MSREHERLAIAEAMQLHDERVSGAIDKARKARIDLEIAESWQRHVMQARDTFKNAIKAKS